MNAGYVTIINTTNVNRAFEDALWSLRNLDPEPQQSRNGPVLAFPGPVVTTLHRPRERVLFWDRRDANPFFHLMESLWMLAGRRDVAFPSFFAKQIEEYSDDGYYLQGAYGYRWRRHLADRKEPGALAPLDQIQQAIDLLSSKPVTRRAVIQMWDGSQDLGAKSKDLPCNLTIVADLRDGRLNFYISNRSNDIVWGLYGANAVHFSILQEYMASALGVPVGVMTTFSVNAHLYTGLKKAVQMVRMPMADDRYAHLGLEPYPLVAIQGDPEYMSLWNKDLAAFLRRPNGEGLDLVDPFFREVAVPMYRSWAAHKDGDVFAAANYASRVLANDWGIAAREWLVRRHGELR